MSTGTLGRLQIQTQGRPPVVTLLGSNAVGTDFWLRLMAEFGSAAIVRGDRIQVPADIFLAYRHLLRSLCEQYRVSPEMDQATKDLLLAIRNQDAALSTILKEMRPLSEEETRQRLLGSRYTRELRPFQLRDLGHLLALPHGANFSVPGAGKTAVAYATYEAERHAGKVKRLLVVAPLSAFDAWLNEAKVCFATPPVVHRYEGRIRPDTEVLVVNYQRLAGNYRQIAGWVGDAPTHVILDEGHRIKKGWTGQWGRAALNLAYGPRRRDLLSGTPAPQSPLDLEAILEFLWPTQGYRLLPEDVRTPTPPSDAGRRIAARIRPLFVRTRKSELALQEPVHRVIRIPLEGLQRDIYMALRNQYAGLWSLDRRDRVNFSEMGKVVMYLLEAATNPALLVAGSSRYDPIQFQHPPLEIAEDSSLKELLANYRQYETPRKFVQLAQLVKENCDMGRKTLIWSNFVRDLQTLERMLNRYKPAVIHGGIPSEVSVPSASRTREQEIHRFRTDPDCMILLANPAATSEGVSLHDVCHDAIYLDRTFNAGQYLQSVDRIHRLGLPPGVETRITFLLTEGTIDEVVDSRVKQKSARLAAMLDDPDIVTMALPDDEDYGPAIETNEDLEALFAHLRGE
jgi:SNF2 family DNA or RNA helicase